ncbi:hypothetical protein [Novosphingobium guangzhouense]|nr:hypothetical protein [Novosphingobium guangzhouense]
MRPEIHRHIVVVNDPDVARLQRQVTLLSNIYRRRILPTLMLAASLMGAVVIISQIANWIAR